jgi:hypothetical protein
MSKLILPEPRSPLQSRAHTLLLAIEKHGQLSRPDLIALNDGRVQDTKRCIVFLRHDRKHIYVCGYTDQGEPIYKIGCEPDARRPKGMRRRRAAVPAPIIIPPPDPLMAALFGRPATV